MKFNLSITMDTEAFGDDQWDREVEVGRILRDVSDMLNGGSVAAKKASLRDRHNNTVGTYEFKEG
jgi:hypothetical protein